MKKNKQTLRLAVLFFAFCFFLIVTSSGYTFNDKRDYYEIKIYHLATAAQAEKVDKYLKHAFIPAMHRAGISRIGVFKPIADSLKEKFIYVFIPYSSLDQFEKAAELLQKDAEHYSAGKEYIDAVYSDPPYARIESILLKSFEGMPSFFTPKFNAPLDSRVYELRSYEGHTEKIYRNKVQMFNKGDEIAIFNKLGFNAIFYGEVLVGSKMPNLMYMTSFESKASRDAHWKAFSEDPDWKKLSAMAEYKNNVSKNTITFLRPTAYSEI
jgi:hypothetical protein